MTWAVEIKDLTFQYSGLRRPTLRNINLTVAKGEKVLILGPSGSGKTTLLRCTNGLIPYKYRGKLEGSVSVDGVTVAEAPLSKISLKVGTILQDPESQFVGISVEEDVAFGLENLCFSSKEMRKRVHESLSLLRMAGLELRQPYELSGGQKQKVAIAGILAMRPDIILFDEPLANLDPLSADEFLVFIDRLSEEHGKTVVLVEHRFEQVLEKGVDKIAVIDQGEIVAYGVPEQIIEESHMLVNIGIRLPLYTEIAYNLRRQGVWKRELPLTIEQSVQGLKETIKLGGAEKIEQIVQPRIGVAGSPIIDLQNVDYIYPSGVTALKGVNLKIYPGESVALLGPNGAGKSTLALLCVGILRPTKGDVLINGINTKDTTVAKLAETVGLVFQNPNHMLFKNRVIDEVSFGPQNLGFEPMETEKLVERSVQICDLQRYRSWPPLALSMGEKRRVTVASILSMNPKVLFFDEPTVGQDHRHSKAFMSFVSGLRGRGYSTIVITHDVNLVIEYTDRAVILLDGRVIADGETRTVLADDLCLRKANLKPSSLTLLAKSLDIPFHVLTSEEFQRLIGSDVR